MTSIDAFMPGYRASSVESAAVAGRRLAGFLAAIVVGLARVLVPHIFTLAALAAFVVAAFTVGSTAGWVTVGVGLLLFEWKIRQ